MEKSQWGPLAGLAGVWEGELGKDYAPSPNREEALTEFREELHFDPLAPVKNHEQLMYVLRYRTTAWPKGSDEPFHEELGYWMWDPGGKQVLRCFTIPRGVTILAGGTVEADAREFQLLAEVGSDKYGICSNRFLNLEFRTVRYELNFRMISDDEFSYEEDTVIQIKGRSSLFHHKDSNTLRRRLG